MRNRLCHHGLHNRMIMRKRHFEKPGEKDSELSLLFFNQLWMHEPNRLKISD